MSIVSCDFIDYACAEIEDENSTEFKSRNASSRAYYALYHKTRKRIEDLGLVIVSIDNAGSHSAVIETIRRISPKAKAFATDMDRAKRFRTNCDYDLLVPIPHNKARKHIIEVQRLLDLLDRIE